MIFRRGSGCISVIVLFILLLSTVVFAHDKNHPVSPQMKSWFDGLKSGRGLCCSDADGTALSDVDWDTMDGHYRVRLEGRWFDVPDDAVLKQPNLYGLTMVWPVPMNGHEPPIAIRCFIVGSMT